MLQMKHVVARDNDEVLWCGEITREENDRVYCELIDPVTEKHLGCAKLVEVYELAKDNYTFFNDYDQLVDALRISKQQTNQK